jgi:hypothetical protein
MKTIMFVDVDEGYPNRYIIDVNADMYAQLEAAGFELEAEDDLYNEVFELINNSKELELPCNIDQVVVLISY